MLIFYQCSQGWHMQCFMPLMEEMLVGKWFSPCCIQQTQVPRVKQQNQSKVFFHGGSHLVGHLKDYKQEDYKQANNNGAHICTRLIGLFAFEPKCSSMVDFHQIVLECYLVQKEFNPKEGGSLDVVYHLGYFYVMCCMCDNNNSYRH